MLTFRPLVTLLLAVSFGAPTLAATITVDTTADTLAADGGCSLREAITAANGDVPAFDCPTGDGPDRIVFALPPGAVILLQADLPTCTASSR